MKKKQKHTEPLVTSVASVVRSVQDTRPFTADEVRAEKRVMHGILKDSLRIFSDKLKSGEVEMSTSLDLERLVKMMMLIMGEPDGVPQADVKQTVVTFAEPLSLDDPDVKSVYERLTESYNDHNDQGSGDTYAANQSR